MSILLHDNTITGRKRMLRSRRLKWEGDVLCVKFLNDIFKIREIMVKKKYSLWLKGDVAKSVCNPNGWFLLFCSFPLHEMGNKTCFDAHLENEGKLSCDEDTLVNNVKLLNCFFNFNPNKFLELYHYDNSCLWFLINSVVNVECFMNNRFHSSMQTGSVEAVLHPIKYKVPNISLKCDGLNFPVEVCKYSDDIRIEEVDIDGFGVATYILCDDEVIDCVKVNDFRLYDSVLSLRKRFLHRGDKDVAASLRCMNFDEMIKAGKLIGANSKDGLLVRECGDDIINGKWFRWCGDSIYLAPVMKSGLPGSIYFNYDKVAYYNMSNERVGAEIDREIAPTVVLDDIDIINFEKIMELGV